MRIFTPRKLLSAAVMGLGATVALAVAILGSNPMAKLQPKAILKGSGRHVNCVTFSADSKLVAAGQQDGTLTIWETATGAKWHSVSGQDVPEFQFHASVSGLSFSSDGCTLAWAASSAKVPLLDVKAKKSAGWLEEQEGPIAIVQFSPCGKFLATATAIKSGIVRLWDLNTKKGRLLFDQKKSMHSKERVPHIGSLAFDRNGKKLAIGIFGAVVFVNVADGTELGAAQGYQRLIEGLVSSPDGKWLAGITNKGISFWDVESHQEAFCLALQNSGGAPRSLAFSPDAKMLALGAYDGVHLPSYVQIWRVGEKEEIGRFVCHQDIILQLSWSPDGKTLATASADATVKLWDVPSVLKSFAK